MRAAVYCRVSTDQDDQVHSFESQKRYFQEYIARKPGWELYAVYADEGITGTSTAGRDAFNRMIRDAGLRCFDKVLTKEVSRFSRNILDTISYTRKLRELGIGVVFLTDGIDTLEADSELRLSIMGSIAQEESRRTSFRVKWGQMRRMEQGVVFGRSLLGYDVQGGRITVEPEGAETVRLIFCKYVHERKGTTVIARELREAGRRTRSGRMDWRNTAVLKILRNEKYCGDLKQKKTITPDYLTHRKKYNRGEEEFVFIRDHHEPIVSREIWEEAQREMERRAAGGKYSAGHGNRYPLSGKIKCGGCGKSFVSRSRRRKDGSAYRVWRCGTVSAGRGADCAVRGQIRDEAGMEMVRRSVGMLELDAEALIRDVACAAAEGIRISGDGSRQRAEQMKKELEQVRAKKKSVLDAFFENSISKEDMKLMNAEYDRRIAELTEKIQKAEEEESLSGGSIGEKEIRKAVQDIVRGETASGHFYGSLLDHITVYPGRRAEVHLKALPAKWTYRLERTAAKDG